MIGSLRRLSFYVDEPEKGQFFWVIHESTSDPTVWIDVQSHELPSDNWGNAWASGHIKFLNMVDDRRIGPRATSGDESSSRVGESK